MDAQVVIVGAGPVGLAAAIDLDSRGIRTVVVERRRYLESPSVKSNHVSARTMERFRMLGIADEVRRTGLPEDYPHDVAFRTTVTGLELSRIQIPASGQRFTATEGPDTVWATPEPAHRINQTYLEPVLMRHATGLPNVTLVTEAEFTGFEQGDNGVRAYVRRHDTNERLVVDADFLIGCDGGSSSVRKQIGSQFHGDPVLQDVQST